ncbi:prenyltransferase [Sporobacter termitidis]|nr:UbiA family prenyltransferase [Sporobacter termitidis]
MLGSVYSLYFFHRLSLCLMIILAIAMMLIQGSTNMLNDYFDYKRGADSLDKADEKALASGEVTPKQVLTLIAVFASAALVIGIIISNSAGWGVMLVAAVGAAVALLYSSGPKPISHTPFGEAAAGITMGLGITSTVAFIQSGAFSWHYIVMAVPEVIFIAYIMFTNNLCDLEKDQSAGRRTLPGMLGFQAAKSIWLLCCLLLVSITVILIIIGAYPAWDLLAIALLFNYRTMIKFRSYGQGQFDKGRMMGIIGRLGIQYHVLMVLGLVIAYLGQFE